jgi:hypothetical protein
MAALMDKSGQLRVFCKKKPLPTLVGSGFFFQNTSNPPFWA